MNILIESLTNPHIHRQVRQMHSQWLQLLNAIAVLALVGPADGADGLPVLERTADCGLLGRLR